MTDFRIKGSGGQGGHVEQAADFFSTAGDMGAAVLFARFSVIGRHPHQSGDLVAIEPAQFRQMRQQHGAGLRADAGSASQQPILMLQIIVGLDVVINESSSSRI
jgi:hypothetical protein